MVKIQYEIVAIEANKILDKILLSNEDDDIIENYYSKYIEYLVACGWSNEEFDKETQIRLDKNWFNKINN